MLIIKTWHRQYICAFWNYCLSLIIELALKRDFVSKLILLVSWGCTGSSEGCLVIHQDTAACCWQQMRRSRWQTSLSQPLLLWMHCCCRPGYRLQPSWWLSAQGCAAGVSYINRVPVDNVIQDAWCLYHNFSNFRWHSKDSPVGLSPLRSQGPKATLHHPPGSKQAVIKDPLLSW